MRHSVMYRTGYYSIATNYLDFGQGTESIDRIQGRTRIVRDCEVIVVEPNTQYRLMCTELILDLLGFEGERTPNPSVGMKMWIPMHIDRVTKKIELFPDEDFLMRWEMW